MKLHHFYRASDLDGIAEKRLHPHVAHEAIMSLGHEVVWLQTTATTEEDETMPANYRLATWRRHHHLGR
jgi:hypothetical protein